MAKSLRLSEEEQELIRKKAVELNKSLVGKGLEPLKDSELAHELETSTKKRLCNKRKNRSNRKLKAAPIGTEKILL